MASSEINVVRLRRYDTGQPWGFKMQGGSEVGIPLQVAEVSFRCGCLFIIPFIMRYTFYISI